MTIGSSNEPNPRVQRRQAGETRRPGVPAGASGQPTDDLPFGRYVIQESAAALPSTRARAAQARQAGEWRLVAVTCTGG